MLISKPITQKMPIKKLQAQNCRNLKIVPFSITNLLKFSVNNFFHVHLFPIISTDLAFFWIHANRVCFKISKNANLQEIKKWLNQLKNFSNKHF